jgi:hypothetical protein
MLIEKAATHSDLLSKIAADLDIPDHIYEDATLKYEEVGEWLHQPESPLHQYQPEIYPQGSFRLGTVVKPVHQSDEYDIDLVCLLNIDKEGTTQANLKKIVGDRLQANSELKNILASSRRCWTLTYENQFHMDVLPSIPNTQTGPTGLLLTDTELTQWQKSNPKAYADWFYSRMTVIFESRRKTVADSVNASIEDVPEWQVKTPLQQAVQILKRHRDIYFEDNYDNRPVSIIITTLAAHAYNNQADVGAALIDITKNMHAFIEKRNDKWWVQNPVDRDENFADKWNEKPDRRDAFFQWLISARDFFGSLPQKRTLVEAADSLSSTLGKDEVQRVSEVMGIKPKSGLPARFTSILQVPALGATNHVEPPRWPMQISAKANVRAFVYKTKAKNKLWEVTSRPVPKNVWLKFIVNTNVTGIFDVQWQVVNSGSEAEQADSLRGEFYKSDEIGPSPVRWEQTAYKGTHWVQALIIKNGVCVAKSEKKMVLIR